MIAIRVEHLSKKYTIGAAQVRHNTLRDMLADTVKRLNQARLKDAARTPENEIWALEDVSFEIQRGEVVGVIGRNGAGKSTLLKILAHITSPTRGRVEIHGRVGSLLEVGTGFHSELTGRENIFLNGAILGMKRAEINRKFDEMVAFAEIEKFLDTPVKHYSSGMYMRLAFAVAAHLEPEILLVDEVLAVGDAQFQKKCLGKMGEVAGEGRTVLFVSHNMGAVRSLCNKGILFRQGNIDILGDIDTCVDKYLDQSNMSIGGEYKTGIDETKDIYFYGIRVKDKNGASATIIEYSEGFQIEIDYIVQKSINNICFSLAILNNQDEQVLLTRNVDATMRFPSVMEKGEKKYTIKFPVRFFTPGKYYLQLELLQFRGEKFQSVQRICGFEIIDTKSSHASLGFSWSCKVTLPLNWELSSKTD
jgi:lipopolysaccharide transport system ATP-binding protein